MTECLKNILHNARLFIYALILALLSGCLIPEQFDAKVTINKDGSYTFTYDGTLAFAPALAASLKGELSAKDEAAFKQEAVKIAREPGFKKVNYLGKGRYKVSVEKMGKAGEPYYFPSDIAKVFAILPQKDGTLSVSAIRPDKKAIQELNSIGAKIDGTLTVSVANGTKVLKHNAQSQPAVFGLFGGYKWQIKSPDENPFIIILNDHAAQKMDSELKKYIGTWTDNNSYLLVEISYTGNSIRIREAYGSNAPAGTEFFGKYSGGGIIAVGDPKDFYKFELPEFKLLENGELHHRCGACSPEDKLKKTAIKMPKVTYSPPVNGD